MLLFLKPLITIGFGLDINIQIIAPDDSQTDKLFLVSIVRVGFWAG